MYRWVLTPLVAGGWEACKMNVGRNRVFRTVDDDELDILLRGTRRAGRQGANGIMGGQLQSAEDILALSDETGGKVHTGVSAVSRYVPSKWRHSEVTASKTMFDKALSSRPSRRSQSLRLILTAPVEVDRAYPVRKRDNDQTIPYQFCILSFHIRDIAASAPTGTIRKHSCDYQSDYRAGKPLSIRS